MLFDKKGDDYALFALLLFPQLTILPLMSLWSFRNSSCRSLEDAHGKKGTLFDGIDEIRLMEDDDSDADTDDDDASADGKGLNHKIDTEVVKLVNYVNTLWKQCTADDTKRGEATKPWYNAITRIFETKHAAESKAPVPAPAPESVFLERTRQWWDHINGKHAEVVTYMRMNLWKWTSGFNKTAKQNKKAAGGLRMFNFGRRTATLENKKKDLFKSIQQVFRKS